MRNRLVNLCLIICVVAEISPTPSNAKRDGKLIKHKIKSGCRPC